MMYDVDRLNAIPFSQVAEWLDSTRRKGCRKVTHCPWHDDTNPSLTLYEANGENHCHCFACGKGGSVIDYVMQQQHLDFKGACEALAGRFGIVGNDRYGSRGMARAVRKQVKPREFQYIPMEIVERHISSTNSLCDCLRQLYAPWEVERVTNEYLLGRYELNETDGYTLFPNVDTQLRVHNIKAQLYNSDISSGQFCHYVRNHVLWLGKLLVDEGVMTADREFDSDCLFGEHLLANDFTSIVALVESPKNAVVGSLEMPQYIWLATGSKSQLKRSVLKVLQGRQVMVFPDRDGIQEWKESLKGMADIADFCVSDICERIAPPDELKFDIADFFINRRTAEHEECPF